MISSRVAVKFSVLVLALSCALFQVTTRQILAAGGESTQLNTNVAVLGSSDAVASFAGDAKARMTVVDPNSLLEGAQAVAKDDIQEDPNDRFITSRSGKRRPRLMDDEGDEWAEEISASKSRRINESGDKVLSRVKRCGDDDGDARRSRRARRARRARARRARRARKAAAASSSATTTTVTRKVIQNGQVVSETTQAGPSVATVHHTGPAVPSSPVTVPAQQPVVIQQQPAAPQVAATQPQAVAGVPSISVQGSVKVN